MAVWILDASHGGSDTGIVGGKLGRKESTVVLNAVLEAKNHLERNGETVILTRDCDKNMSIEERIQVCGENRYDYFVSVSMNSSENPMDKGVVTSYLYDSEENIELSKFIRDEIISGLRAENGGSSLYEGEFSLRIKKSGVVVFGDYLTTEEVEKEFDSELFGKQIAKGCLAMVNKVLLVHEYFEPKKLQNKAYRLCVGYYKDIDSAFEALKDMKEKGYIESYLVPFEG